MRTYFVFACVFAAAFAATQFIAPNSSQVGYLGRFDHSDPLSVKFDWSGVAVSLSFVGNSVSILLKDVGNWYDLYIDGSLSSKVINTTQTTGLIEYELASFDVSSEHTVRLVKRTEALFGIVTFGGFLVGGAPSTPLQTRTGAATRRIEFLGDSLTCGYGNLGIWPCHFSADTEDVSLSFPGVVARRFGAQLNVECWSGVVRNYGDANTTSPDPFPIYYSRTVANNPSSPAVDPSLFDSDAIVICLGANDFSTKPHPPDDVFIEGYVALIKRVQADHPRAKLFLASGVGDSDPQSQTAKLVGATYISLSGLVGSDLGCDYHPTTKADQRLGDKIASIVGPAMGWN